MACGVVSEETDVVSLCVADAMSFVSKAKAVSYRGIPSFVVVSSALSMVSLNVTSQITMS
jgi:hypothetical protein